MKAFYFATEIERLRYNDNRPIIVGETHTVEGEPKCCVRGLHASKHLIDALMYAPGHILYLVELSGEIDEGNDKVAAQNRKYLARFDAEELLRKFARRQALINVEKVRPYCSEEDYKVILHFLNTGLGRKKARSVAWEIMDSVGDSAATRSVFWATAASAVEAAAEAMVRATRAKLWAAEAMTRSAAEAMTRSAAWAEANEMLTEMVKEATGWEI